MTLTAGSRLGPYEIVAPLGAGGMGEVYKARDTRLDRTVAIKLLPAPVASDPQRRERFRREARAISSLAHAHICTLLDVGEQDGVEFLVMEYLAGETLAHRLLRGPLPLDLVLQLAAELADALDAAHRQGVIHRDLKPANVMLTKAGVKVLDFGLAKWNGCETDVRIPSAVSLGSAPSTLTQVGTAVGTLPYMAPEQLEGRTADARSDLFALGAIVYEMTTGRRPFEGTGYAALIAAIQSATPAPMTAFSPLTPPALEHVVEGCLAKNPDERWQSAGDVARELKWIGKRDAQLDRPTHHVSPKRLTYAWIAGTILFAAMTAVLSLQRAPDRPIETTSARFTLSPPEHAVYPKYNQLESPPVVSPDGRQIAFVAHEIGRSDLVWVRSLDRLAARALPGTDGVTSSSLRPFWSPDSRSIAFFADGKLKRVDLDGGPPRVLADAPDARGGTWNEQGVIVFAPNSEGPLYRVPASGGPVASATTLQTPGSGHRFPMFLPDGRHFFYLNRTLTDLSKWGIDVASIDSSDTTRVISVPNLPTNVAYANGYLVFVRAGTLYAQPFDPIRLAFNGEPAAIAEQVAHDAGTGALFSVSTNGVLVYRSQAASVRTQLTWIDRTGRTVGTIGSVTSQDSPVLSQDGTHIALIRPSDLPNSDDVWLINLASGASSRLTFDGGSYSPVWSPDGRYIAFGTQRHLTNSVIDAVFRKAAAGTGDAELLFRGRFTTYPSDWSRNGQFIIYVERDRATKNDLWALPLDAERKPIPLVRTNGDDALGRLSPDGRWLAYTSDVSGREEVYVQTFPVPHGKWQISISGGTQPRWRRDAKELYYVAANGQLLGVAVRTEGAEFESGVQQRLFVLPPSHGEDSIYDVSADGSRFLVNSVVSDTSQPIVVTLNWTAGLKK